MDTTAVTIVAIVIGIPVVCGIGYAVLEEVLKWRLKVHELRVEEKRLDEQRKLAQDELNARILRMDDLGISPLDIASLTEEVRQLRQEVSSLKQQINDQTTHRP